MHEITFLPVVTKIITLIIHRRMMGVLFMNMMGNEQRGVRASQGCKETVIENLSINEVKKEESKEESRNAF